MLSTSKVHLLICICDRCGARNEFQNISLVGANEAAALVGWVEGDWRKVGETLKPFCHCKDCSKFGDQTSV